MKYYITLIFALLLCTRVFASNFLPIDFILDGICYAITSDSTCAVAHDNKGVVYKGDIIIPTTAKGYRVTAIDEAAFSSISGLTSLYIPSSVIGMSVISFIGCSDMESIKIASDNKIFDSRYDCNAVIETATNKLIKGCSNTTIPNDVYYIEEYAFENCKKLANIYIPSSIRYFETGAFRHCDNLKQITIPEGVIFIGTECFAYCDSLKSVTISSSVTTIWHDIFYGCCQSIEITDLAKTPQKIYDDTFVERQIRVHVLPGCGDAYRAADIWKNFNIVEDAIDPSHTICYTTFDGKAITLESTTEFGANLLSNTYEDGQGKLIFDNKPTQIADEAFTNCGNLASIIIPNSITQIGSNVFSGCYNLKSIIVDAGNAKYDSRNHCNAIIETKTNSLILGCKGTIIPNSVASIKASAFEGCLNLSNINIPKSVTSIGNSAFADCQSLTDVTNLSANPQSLSSNVFSSKRTLHVLPGRGDTYRSASGWGEFELILEDAEYSNQIGDVPNQSLSTGNIIYYTTLDDKAIVTPKLNYVAENGVSYQPTNTYNDGQGKIVIISQITTIPSSSFKDRTSLTSITIPYSVTSIGTSAYAGCSNLTTTTIPKNVKSIGEKAFSGCSSLTDVTNLAKTPQKIASGTFEIQNTLHVLPGCGDAYRAADVWKDFACILEDAEDPSQNNGNVDNPVYSIYYTSTNGQVVEPSSIDALGSKLLSNTYKNGQGVFVFDEIVTQIGTSAFKNCSNLKSISVPSDITSIGVKAFEGCTSLTKINIPDGILSIGEGAFSGCSSLTSINIPNYITSITASVFSGCTSLTNVTIPNNVTAIGAHAFSGCNSLTSITIPAKVTSIGEEAFANCTGLSSVTNLASAPQTINPEVFSIKKTLYVLPGCGDIYHSASVWKDFEQIIEISDDSQNILYYTSSDGQIVTPNSISAFGVSILYNSYKNGQGELSFHEKVTTIGDEAFMNCENLASITIPQSVTQIKEKALAGCSNLMSVIIPNNVSTIGDEAFAGCTDLVNVTNYATTPQPINSNVFTVKNILHVPFGCGDFYRSAEGWKDFRFILEDLENSYHVIYYTTSDKKVVIPVLNNFEVNLISNTYENGQGRMVFDGVITKIGSRAFNNCITLTGITLPNGVTEIGSNAFNTCVELRNINIPNRVTEIGSNAFYSCFELSNIKIPNSVTKIGDEAFCNCTKLKSINIPEGISSISANVFGGCSSIKSFTIPNSVTSIGEMAFGGCSSLTSITIPSNVTQIGEGAFIGCNKLTSVTNLTTTPQDINYKYLATFSVQDTLHVHPGCGDVYRAADIWKDFKYILEDGAPYVITDGTEYTNSSLIKSADVNYSRTFNNTNWQALYVPFSMRYEDYKEDLEIAWLNDTHMYDDNNDGTPDRASLEFFVMTEGETEPNTPYMVKAKEKGTYNATFKKTDVYPAETPSFECSTFKQTFTVTGTYSGVTGADMVKYHYYAPADGKLKYALNENASLKPQRWYLKVSNKDGSPVTTFATSIRMIVDGETVEDEETGILNIEDSDGSSTYYTVDGRAIKGEPEKSGIYVNNKKKIIVK